jgi:hypothetical protein
MASIDEDEILRAFRACPRVDYEVAKQHCPNLVKVAERISKALMVCWEWGLLAVVFYVETYGITHLPPNFSKKIKMMQHRLAMNAVLEKWRHSRLWARCEIQKHLFLHAVQFVFFTTGCC